MQKDKEGFLIPIVKETKCIDCNLCVEKCPVINKPIVEKNPKKIYAAFNLNSEQHRRSASGGLFSAFANYFYSLKDGVVCASAFNSSLHLRFILSKNKEDLKHLRGSKYVQSEVGFVFKDIRKQLIQGKQVFFIGTPCQVAGLRAYLGKEYGNLFTIDLVCHGVPSPDIFSTYLNSVGVNTKEEYVDYFFRSQKNSIYYINSYKRKSGRAVYIPNCQHSYISAYLKGWIHREVCYNCPCTGEHRFGDVTISDFWGILSGKIPFKKRITNGVSMLMINTKRGRYIFELIKKQLYFEEKTFVEALVDNHNLVCPDLRPKERDYMYLELASLSPEDFMLKYNCKVNTPSTLWKRIFKKILRILHM